MFSEKNPTQRNNFCALVLLVLSTFLTIPSMETCWIGQGKVNKFFSSSIAFLEINFCLSAACQPFVSFFVGRRRQWWLSQTLGCPDNTFTCAPVAAQAGFPAVRVHPLRVVHALVVLGPALAVHVWVHVETALARLTHRARSVQ